METYSFVRAIDLPKRSRASPRHLSPDGPTPIRKRLPDSACSIYAVADGVAAITLNKPNKLNALDGTMVAALWDSVRRAATDPEARVIVLTGAGRAYCKRRRYGIRRGRSERAAYEDGAPVRHGATSRLPDAPSPVPFNSQADHRHDQRPGGRSRPTLRHICDIRFVAEEAVSTTVFARRGPAAEYESAWILTRLVGQANATHLLLTAPLHGAGGFPYRTCQSSGALRPARRHGLRFAQEMVRFCSPAAMKAMKVPFETPAESVRGQPAHGRHELFGRLQGGDTQLSRKAPAQLPTAGAVLVPLATASPTIERTPMARWTAPVRGTKCRSV